MKFARWVYHRIITDALKTRIRKLRSRVQDIWIPVYHTDSDGLTAIQIGEDSLDPYVDKYLFGGALNRKKVGRVFGWNIDQAIQQWEEKVDLILVSSSLFRLPDTLNQRIFELPYFVRQVVELPQSSEDLYSYLYKYKGGSARTDLKRVRKAQFDYEVTCNEALLSDFYHQLYAPYIQERYAQTAELEPWSVFKALYGEKELLVIRKDGELAAGAVREQKGKTYYCLLAGVSSDGSQNFLKMGINSAVYWFTFVEAHRRGCHEVDLGSSRPFLKDGVLTYKKKWSNRVAMSTYKRNQQLFVLPCSNSSAMQRFFENNPFLCEKWGRLIGLVFMGANTLMEGDELAEYLKRIAIDVEGGSIYIIAMNQEWAMREDEIRSIMGNYVEKMDFIDNSDSSIRDVSEYLSQRFI